MRNWAFNKKIRNLTNGKVVRIDFQGIIKEVIERGEGLNIMYEIKSAEKIDYKEIFNVIFCNSAFQWFKNSERAIKNCYKALRRNGRIGIRHLLKSILSKFYRSHRNWRKECLLILRTMVFP